jgi:hypothetical protein
VTVHSCSSVVDRRGDFGVARTKTRVGLRKTLRHGLVPLLGILSLPVIGNLIELLSGHLVARVASDRGCTQRPPFRLPVGRIRKLQEHLGRSSIAVTMDRYGFSYPSSRVEVAQTLDAVYSDRPTSA